MKSKVGHTRGDTDINLIFNRSHLGETVYSPLYRGYSGDYVFDIEKKICTISTKTRVILNYINK